MGQVMWLGTRGHEQWVKAPATSADFSRKRMSKHLDFTNGGAASLGPRSTHAEYNMSWNVASRLEMRKILDFAGHVYDNDPLARFLVPENLIYFIDPMEMEMNLAPINWGQAFLAATDAPSLFADARPIPVATSSNDLGYPTFSAQYAFTTGSTPRSLYIPIPPGHTLWAGFHGFASGLAGVQVTPVGGAARRLTPLGLSAQRVVDSFDGASGVDIQIVGAPGETVTLTSLALQVLRSDRVAEGGSFISGRGHSGCAFDDEPTVAALSTTAQHAEVSAAAKLVEVGAWL